MTNKRSEQFARALKKEVPLWIEAGVIQQTNAVTLLAMYPVTESSNRLITIISILGSVLVGLGVLLFVGSNWQAMSSLMKLGIICGFIVTVNMLALKLHFHSHHQKLGSALFLLGGMIYGAGVWLIAQTFQLDLNWSLGLSIWSFGLIPMAVVTRSHPLVVLNGLVLLLWGYCQPQFFQALIVFALAMFLSYSFKSRSAMVMALIQGLGIWYSGQGSQIIGPIMPAFLYASTLFSWYLWHRSYKPLFANCYLVISLFIGFCSVYITTIDSGGSFTNSNSYLPLATLVMLTTASITYVFKTVKTNRDEIAALIFMIPLMMAIMSIGNTFTPVTWPFKLLANAILFSSLIAVIYSGARRLESTIAVNICTVFFAIAVLTRYFDTFFAMMNRSIFFILGGLILLAGGYLLEQQRRTFVRGIAHE
ncbi:MAG: DUF2157 domain-containing protein [Candidatus Obscuribacterales bacterium]|nr:DUF2157 domain-containing protein [Candidatus Obscuribacterales bacterium]